MPAQPRRIALVRRFSTNEGDLTAQVRAVGIVLGREWRASGFANQNQGACDAPKEQKAVSHKSKKMRSLEATLEL